MFVTLVSSGARRLTDKADAAILRGIAELRVGWLSDVFRAIDRMATGWTMFFVTAALVVGMVVFKRWRHLFTFLASVMVMQVLGLLLIAAYSRPRPFDVTIIGRWQGYSNPSATLAIVSSTVVGIIYALVVAGRSRSIAKIVGGVVIGVIAIGRLYLAIDHPFDVVTGIAFGVVFPLLAFRVFTPNEFVPVTYRGGRQRTST